MTEEERAALWRSDAAARASSTAARLAGLRGSQAARNVLALAWQPYVLRHVQLPDLPEIDSELLP